MIVKSDYWILIVMFGDSHLCKHDVHGIGASNR